jgi:hypothetical protein
MATPADTGLARAGSGADVDCGGPALAPKL